MAFELNHFKKLVAMKDEGVSANASLKEKVSNFFTKHPLANLMALLEKHETDKSLEHLRKIQAMVWPIQKDIRWETTRENFREPMQYLVKELFGMHGLNDYKLAREEKPYQDVYELARDTYFSKETNTGKGELERSGGFSTEFSKEICTDSNYDLPSSVAGKITPLFPSNKYIFFMPMRVEENGTLIFGNSALKRHNYSDKNTGFIVKIPAGTRYVSPNSIDKRNSETGEFEPLHKSRHRSECGFWCQIPNAWIKGTFQDIDKINEDIKEGR